jgi:general secretion pathway protein E
MTRFLAQILQERFGIDDTDMQEAVKTSAEKGTELGELLIARKLLSETQLLQAQGALYGIAFWETLPLDNFCTDFTEKVPIQFLKKYWMVPLKLDGGIQAPGPESQTEAVWPKDLSPDGVIAVYSPSCFHAFDDLVRVLALKRPQMVLSTREAILSAINLSYDLIRDSAQQLVETMEENGNAIISEIEGTTDLLDDTSDAPIIKLVNHIISQSAKARASDIHIEPYQNSFKVRYRVDGILYDLLSPPKWIQPALISRIKVMARLNIAEKRLPQDGRIDVKLGNQDIDVRVSTVPTSFGERVVMRLLNKTGSLLSLSDIGPSAEKLSHIKRLVQSPNGIILVTGPTGSGKTTTLYAILQSINKPDINIITVEDPIEYQINGISQIQVNPKINLTFARGLRSIVRQDPDVILIGEIRDRETADIAVQSALTGHLVFSTLHTNDSASAITRLVDIGVEPCVI